MSVKIFKGDDLVFTIRVKEDGGCYNLTSVTAATLKIPLQAGGSESLTLGAGLTIPTPSNGEIVVNIDNTISTNFKVGAQTLELILDESGELKTLQFKNGLVVSARLY